MLAYRSGAIVLRIRGFRRAFNRDGSFDDTDRDGAPSPSRVGSDLRAARERLGWTLPDLASHLRIRLPFLQAIEEGRVDALPGNAYAVGFLRTYAQAVGLDPDEIARRFRAEAADLNQKTELSFPAPAPERGIPAGALILLGALLVIGAYVGWYRMSGNGPPTPEPVAEVPARLAPLAEARPVAAPENITAPIVVAAVPTPVPEAPPLPQYGPPAPVVEPVPPGTRIVIRAGADTWMQVRDKQGPVLLNRVMRAGETWPVPPGSRLLFTTANAGRTELLVDGVAAPSLGTDGRTRRDIPLDPEALRRPSPARR